MPGVQENISAVPVNAEHPHWLTILENIDCVIPVKRIRFAGYLEPGKLLIQILLRDLPGCFGRDGNRAELFTGLPIIPNPHPSFPVPS